MRAFFVTLFVSLAAVYAFNLRFATTSPPLETTASLAAQQTPNHIVVSDNTLYQRGWTRARLMAPPTAEQPCPDLVVLGSSATGTIESEMFPGRRLLNGWHGNFSVQDMESYTTILGAAPCKPKDIVVGIDLFWSANASWNMEGWQELAGDYAAYQSALSPFGAFVPLRVRWDEYKENLGFGRSIDTLRAGRERGFRTDALARGGVRLVEAKTLEEICARVEDRETYLRSYDGHYLRCPNNDTSVESSARQATDYLAGNIHNIADWHEVATARVDRVEAVIKAWRAKGIAIVMLGIPYNPITWKILTSDTTVGPNIRELDQRLERIATASGATFLNLRDATSVPCTAPEFEDSHHPRPACMRRVTAKAAEALSAAKRDP